MLTFFSLISDGLGGVSEVILNFFERLLDFSQQYVVETNGLENSNVHNFLQDLHINPSTFFNL